MHPYGRHVLLELTQKYPDPVQPAPCYGGLHQQEPG